MKHKKEHQWVFREPQETLRELQEALREPLEALKELQEDNQNRKSREPLKGLKKV